MALISSFNHSKTVFLSTLAATFLGFSCSAWAYMVSPLRVDLEVGKATSVSVSNSHGDKPLTYETSVMKRIIKTDGSIEKVPADDDFVVIPPSGIVEAGTSQALRIQYVGDNLENVSSHYYLNVKEIPIKLDQSKIVDPNGGKIQANINMAFAYNVAINVASPDLQPDVQLISVEGGKKVQKKVNNKEETKDAIAISVENKGKKYAYIQDYTLDITKSDGKSLILKDKELKKGDGTPLLPAGMTRTFLIPVTEAMPSGTLKAKLYK